MNAYHLEKIERLFRARFDDIVRPRMGIPEDMALQAGFDDWNRWIRANRIHSRHYADNQKHEGFVQIHDPTGFKALLVPIDLAEKALALDCLP